MSIKIEHVSHLYGEGEAFEKKALDDVTLEIPDGQFLGVIGHTGSGKSTLIQHLNGLLKATSGTIYYNNEDIYQENYDMKKLRSKVGLVFQSNDVLLCQPCFQGIVGCVLFISKFQNDVLSFFSRRSDSSGHAHACG